MFIEIFQIALSIFKDPSKILKDLLEKPRILQVFSRIELGNYLFQDLCKEHFNFLCALYTWLKIFIRHAVYSSLSTIGKECWIVFYKSNVI